MSAFKAMTLLPVIAVLSESPEEFCKPIEKLPYPGDEALTNELSQGKMGGPRSNIPTGALAGGCTANFNWADHHLQQDDFNDGGYSKTLATEWATKAYTKPKKIEFKKNKLTPVKSQEQCGSCWAHGAVESLETAIANAYGEAPVSISVQQVMSEVGQFDGGSGCTGGAWPMMALKYAQYAGQVLAEASDPYISQSSCKQNDYHKIVSQDSQWVSTHIESVEQLIYDKKEQAQKVFMQALDAGHTPVVVINCACLQHNYEKGSLLRVQQMSAQKLNFRPDGMSFFGNNHAVQLVGYNTEHTTPYWILRNSWGTSNAEYVFVEMGSEEDTDDVLGHNFPNYTSGNDWMNNAYFPKMGAKQALNSTGLNATQSNQQNGTLLSANRQNSRENSRRQATREASHGASRKASRRHSHRAARRHSSHARRSRRSTHSRRHAQRSRSSRRQQRRSERH